MGYEPTKKGVVKKKPLPALFLHNLDLDINYSEIHVPDFQANKGLTQAILGGDQ